MATITLADVASHDPDHMLPPSPEYVNQYWDRVAYGRREARRMKVAFVAICRNAMPWVQMTLERVRQTGEMFGGGWKCFVYENDSTDGTQDFLVDAARQDGRLSIRLNTHRRPHLNMCKTPERTFALAEYRNECRDWVRANASEYQYTIVFDTDPWGGWSVNGVANSLGWLEDYENDLDSPDNWGQDWGLAAGMASYSWCQWPTVSTPAHYDAWAARWNHWNERSQDWFHLWHPPVGSEPVRFNSAFGQLGLYRTRNFLEGTYRGGDCEHVSHWRTCGGDCYLNPSQRVVSFWNLDSDEKEPDRRTGIHEDVDGGSPDSRDCRDSAGLSGSV